MRALPREKQCEGERESPVILEVWGRERCSWPPERSGRG